MKNIPLALKQAKNLFGEGSCWLVLLKIVMPMPVNQTFRVVANTEDVEFGGYTYTAFPFTLEFPKEDSTGTIPTMTINVSNVTRVLQGDLEALNGASGTTVEMYIVETSNLTENYAELTMDFEVLSATCTPQWVTFKCGTSNPMRRKLLDKFFATHCNWRFNSATVRAGNTGIGCECNYQGNDAACKHTLEDCEAKSNTLNFGGFPGLDSTGIRFS